MECSLFQQNQRGSIQEWHVSVVGATAVYTWGQQNGKMQIKTRQYSVGKQKRSASEQAVFEAKSVIVKKRRQGYSDSILGADIETEERPPLPMLAKTLHSRKAPLPSTVFVQRKLDGIRCIADTHTGVLVSRQGVRLLKLGNIENAVKQMKQFLPQNVRYVDGELFVLGESFSTIVSLVRKGSSTVRYHVYDVICDLPFCVRLENLNIVNTVGEPLVAVVTEQICSEDIMIHHKMFTEEGYEGTIVRPNENGGYAPRARSNTLLKLKDFHDAEYMCVGSRQEKHGVENLGALELQMEDGRTFFSRPASSVEERRELWINRERLVGQTITVRYFELTDDGIPRFPVAFHVRPSYDC